MFSLPNFMTMPIFMGLMLLIGLFITVYAFNIAKDTDKCPNSSSAAKNAARILISLGMVMVSISGTYLLCGCDNIGKRVNQENIGFMFIIMLMLISIFIIVLVYKVQGGCDEAKHSGSILLILSYITTVLSVLYLGYRIYNIYGSPKLLKKSSTKPAGSVMSAFG